MKPNSENMIQDIYNVQRLDLLDEWNIKYLRFFSEKKFSYMAIRATDV